MRRASSNTSSLRVVQALACSVQSLLGPDGALKCVLGSSKWDDSALVSSPLAVLDALSVEHPAGTLLRATAYGLHTDAGTGVTTLIALVGALARAAQDLRRACVPTPHICRGLSRAMIICETVCRMLRVRVALPRSAWERQPPTPSHLSGRVVQDGAAGGDDDDDVSGDEDDVSSEEEEEDDDEDDDDFGWFLGPDAGIVATSNTFTPQAILSRTASSSGPAPTPPERRRRRAPGIEHDPKNASSWTAEDNTGTMLEEPIRDFQRLAVGLQHVHARAPSLASHGSDSTSTTTTMPTFMMHAIVCPSMRLAMEAFALLLQHRRRAQDTEDGRRLPRQFFASASGVSEDASDSSSVFSTGAAVSLAPIRVRTLLRPRRLLVRDQKNQGTHDSLGWVMPGVLLPVPRSGRSRLLGVMENRRRRRREKAGESVKTTRRSSFTLAVAVVHGDCKFEPGAFAGASKFARAHASTVVARDAAALRAVYALNAPPPEALVMTGRRNRGSSGGQRSLQGQEGNLGGNEKPATIGRGRARRPAAATSAAEAAAAVAEAGISLVCATGLVDDAFADACAARDVAVVAAVHRADAEALCALAQTPQLPGLAALLCVPTNGGDDIDADKKEEDEDGNKKKRAGKRGLVSHVVLAAEVIEDAGWCEPEDDPDPSSLASKKKGRRAAESGTGGGSVDRSLLLQLRRLDPEDDAESSGSAAAAVEWGADRAACPITVALCVPAAGRARQMESRVWRHLKSLRNAVDASGSGWVLPGAGTLELCCAAAIKEEARRLVLLATTTSAPTTSTEDETGWHQQQEQDLVDCDTAAVLAPVLEAVAEAVATLPRVVLQNAGVDPSAAAGEMAHSSRAHATAWAERKRRTTTKPRVGMPGCSVVAQFRMEEEGGDEERRVVLPAVGAPLARLGLGGEASVDAQATLEGQEETVAVYDDYRSRATLFRRAGSIVQLLLRSDAIYVSVPQPRG